MINKINALPGAQVNMKQASSAKSNPEVQEKHSLVSSPLDNKGMEALSNYSKSMINFANKIDVKPLTPITYNNLDEIEGERIFTSDGKLHSIINETDAIKTTYFVTTDNQEFVDYIEIIDKKTGNTILTQHNSIDEDGAQNDIYITKFNPNTKEEEAFTCYKDGELYYTGKNSINKNGERTDITKYFDGYGYHISQDNSKNKTHKFIHISEDMKKIEYNEEKEIKNGYLEKNMEFYEGLPLNYKETKTLNIPNFIGLKPLMDKDLKPAKNFDFNFMEKEIRNSIGEETRYSNGALETKTIIVDGNEVEALFNPNNELIKVSTENFEIEADGKKNIRIKQFDKNGSSKETYLGETMTRVVYTNGNEAKSLNINNETFNPMSYHETERIDGKEKDVLSMYFNSKGQVDKIY